MEGRLTPGSGADVEASRRELSKAVWKWMTRFFTPLLLVLLCVWAVGPDVGATEAAVEGEGVVMEDSVGKVASSSSSSSYVNDDDAAAAAAVAAATADPSLSTNNKNNDNDEATVDDDPQPPLTGRWGAMDVRHASGLTPQAFFHEYVKEGVPVVIKGDASSIRAAALGWNPRRMGKECGDMAGLHQLLNAVDPLKRLVW
jgi:hypothetical protein